MTETQTSRRTLWAYVLPFAVFMAGLALISGVQSLAPKEGAPFWMSEPKYWVFPLQAIACGILLVRFWKSYDWGRGWGVLAGTVVGIAVLALWVSPQWLLGFPARTEGFNPDVFASEPGLWWVTVALRFFRLVIIVPLVEEIFWRGFLLRYLIKEDFASVPLGTFSWFSFGGVVLMFGLAHWGADFVPALITGAAYNLVLIRTKSLRACVIAHAVTNLGLGIYIMQSRQWGFW